MSDTKTTSRQSVALGLDNGTRQQTAQALAQLLCDFQVLSQNVHGLHWNVRGQHFFALHAKYGEIYDRLAEQIDEIAERTLILGQTPPHTLKQYVEKARLQELPTINAEKETVEALLGQLGQIIGHLRSTLDQVDPGTEDMLIGYLQAFEKDLWMLSAWLNA